MRNWSSFSGAAAGRPYFVEGDEPETMHQLMAAALEKAIEDIRRIQKNARSDNDAARPRWPMIVLRSPKGWTGPKEVDGLQIEGTFRAHQVPMIVDADHPDHVALLESWMKSYKAEELFDAEWLLDTGIGGTRAEGRPAHGRQSAHEWRHAVCATCACRISGFMRLTCRRPALSMPKIRLCWASFCGTWSRRIRSA